MAKSRRERTPKAVLKLPDLEHSKSVVLNSLTSASSKRSYDLAIRDNLYPAYIRGLAYLQMKEGSQAAPEFQKLIDHPGIVGDFVTGAIAHLQLGRAQAMKGDYAAARKAYEEF
jgi:hypothetical protein